MCSLLPCLLLCTHILTRKSSCITYAPTPAPNPMPAALYITISCTYTISYTRNPKPLNLVPNPHQPSTALALTHTHTSSCTFTSSFTQSALHGFERNSRTQGAGSPKCCQVSGVTRMAWHVSGVARMACVSHAALTQKRCG